MKNSITDPSHPVFTQTIRKVATQSSPKGVVNLQATQRSWAGAVADMEPNYYQRWLERDAMLEASRPSFKDAAEGKSAWDMHATKSLAAVKRLEDPTISATEYVRRLDASRTDLSRRYGAPRAVQAGLRTLEALTPRRGPQSPPRVTQRTWAAARNHIAALTAVMDAPQTQKRAARTSLENLPTPSLNTDNTDPALLLAPRKRRRL